MRKRFVTTLKDESRRDLKILAAKQDKPANEVLEALIEKEKQWQKNECSAKQ